MLKCLHCNKPVLNDTEFKIVNILKVKPRNNAFLSKKLNIEPSLTTYYLTKLLDDKVIKVKQIIGRSILYESKW